ncbi:hypothetical protein GS627_15985 [Ruegeria sp. HKCCD7318]|nr:hypothetical protein [Ruegeria sp. HKCCD7318]
MSRLFTLKLPDPCPLRMPRKELAEALTLAGYQTTPTTVANWPLDWILINGRQTASTEEAFEYAQLKIDEEHERLLNKRGRRYTFNRIRAEGAGNAA